ncbi:MAG TPA: thioredoxin family protein [Micromonosporaceae bacterium]|nr:thioredoxin family protein [Micromonosporaceae bacterium]
MATKDLTTADFDELTNREGITLVDFWAEWCGPCHRFAPVFERASEENPDILFAKVDTDAEMDLVTRFRISSIPTLMAIRDGVIVFQQAGALPPQMLRSLIDQVRELDMEEVKSRAS